MVPVGLFFKEPPTRYIFLKEIKNTPEQWYNFMWYMYNAVTGSRYI